MNKFRFMDNRYTFYFISGFLVIASILLLLIRGLNYGIDFKGGNIIHLTFKEAAKDTNIKSVFEKINKSFNVDIKAEQIIVQTVKSSTAGENKEFIIQYPTPSTFRPDTGEIDKYNSAIMSSLKSEMPYEEGSLQISNIGPTIGDEMKQQGILAALLSCIGILLYLGWRFDFNSAMGTVIAVVHDLIITLGFISLCSSFIEIDNTILVALLTLLGYSVNDSIVIFDRIRENTRISKNGTPYKDIVDNSINQSLSRTMNTTITTLLALAALYFCGGRTINNFSLVLIIASIIGTYSSNFLAAPIVEDLFHKGKGVKEAESAS